MKSRRILRRIAPKVTEMGATDTAHRRFYSLIWPHAATVLRTAQVMVRESNEAEDLAQETLIKAFKAIDQFVEGTDARAWLMTILRNTRIDRARARKKSEEDVSLDALATEPAGEAVLPGPTEHEVWNDPETILQRFSDEQVIDAMRKLPDEIRWTLLLVDVEGMDHETAATVLGIPVGTVKSRTHRGRRMLRDALVPVAKGLRLLDPNPQW